MGDPQDVKSKGQYHSWSGPEHKLLLRSLVDAINHGFRDASGKFNKLTVVTRILPILHQQLGSKKTYGQYQNRMKILRARYQVLSDFLRCNSGFGWDSETKKFTADAEVWNVYCHFSQSFSPLAYSMNRVVYENEEMQTRKRRKKMTNSMTDVDILLLVLSIITKIRCLTLHTLQIQYPIRRSITKLGQEYIQAALVEDPDHFRHLYRMYPDVFLKLCSIIRERMGIKDTRHVSVEEMLATFLFIVGQNSRYIQAQDRFNRSRFSISTSFNTILKVLNALAPSYMAKPGTTVPPKIRDSTRFYPYFKDCVGAIDGTHILAMITGKDTSSYRNRKGQLSQNVLAACNFDLEFIYVLSGWEGSAHDAKVLQDALTRSTNRLKVPEGKFYLVDCGYANRRNFLAPFRSTRYHLQEFRDQGNDPANQNELFNHRHSCLRNVIERIFGIFKSRFLIFKCAPPFPYRTQAELVLACVVLHNYLRKECRSDMFLPEEVVVQVPNGEQRGEDENNDDEVVHGTQEQQRVNANNWRANIAETMWADAQHM